MPVFPAVPAVTDAEFGLDLAPAHFLINPGGMVEEEIIVAAVKKPFDRAEFRKGRFVRIDNEVDGRMLDAISDMKGVSLETNIIGMHADEASAEIDRYLDQCRQKGFKRVRIIHGYGTGTLRKITQEYLKSHSSFVDHFEAAGEYEGGSGATIVYLK